MGSTYSLFVREGPRQLEALPESFEEFGGWSLALTYSREIEWRPGALAFGGRAPVKVSDELFELASACRGMPPSEGRFDISVGPL